MGAVSETGVVVIMGRGAAAGGYARWLALGTQCCGGARR